MADEKFKEEVWKDWPIGKQRSFGRRGRLEGWTEEKSAPPQPQPTPTAPTGAKFDPKAAKK